MSYLLSKLVVIVGPLENSELSSEWTCRCCRVDQITDKWLMEFYSVRKFIFLSRVAFWLTKINACNPSIYNTNNIQTFYYFQYSNDFQEITLYTWLSGIKCLTQNCVLIETSHDLYCFSSLDYVYWRCSCPLWKLGMSKYPLLSVYLNGLMILFADNSKLFHVQSRKDCSKPALWDEPSTIPVVLWVSEKS